MPRLDVLRVVATIVVVIGHIWQCMYNSCSNTCSCVLVMLQITTAREISKLHCEYCFWDSFRCRTWCLLAFERIHIQETFAFCDYAWLMADGALAERDWPRASRGEVETGGDNQNRPETQQLHPAGTPDQGSQNMPQVIHHTIFHIFKPENLVLVKLYPWLFVVW